MNADELIASVRDKVRVAVSRHRVSGFLRIPPRQGYYQYVSHGTVTKILDWEPGNETFSVHTLEILDRMSDAVFAYDRGEAPW